MMWAFDPSAATASEATTTRAVVLVVVVNQKVAVAISNSFYVVFSCVLRNSISRYVGRSVDS